MLKEEIKEMSDIKLIMFALAYLLRKLHYFHHSQDGLDMANELELRRITK